MADIAVIFHWRPVEMDAMTVQEMLLLWRDQAAARSGERITKWQTAI